jgi:hypothetical protein
MSMEKYVEIHHGIGNDTYRFFMYQFLIINFITNLRTFITFKKLHGILQATKQENELPQSDNFIHSFALI